MPSSSRRTSQENNTLVKGDNAVCDPSPHVGPSLELAPTTAVARSDEMDPIATSRSRRLSDVSAQSSARSTTRPSRPDIASDKDAQKALHVALTGNQNVSVLSLSYYCVIYFSICFR